MERQSIKEKLSRFADGQEEMIELVTEEELQAEPERITGKRMKRLQLPEMNPDGSGAEAFLETAGVDSEIISKVLEDGLIYEDKAGNCVFVGYDAENTAKYAVLCHIPGGSAGHVQPLELRGSHKFIAWPVYPGSGNELLKIYEYPMDALRGMSADKAAGADWSRTHYLAACGFRIEPVYYYTKNHPEVKKIEFHPQNDVAGKSVADGFAQILRKRGFQCRIVQENDNGK